MALTLSPSLLATGALQAYKKMFPVLSVISTDLKEESAKLNQQIIARISKIPTVANFSGTQAANAQDSKTLLQDIPVTLNRHREAVIEWNQSDIESAQIEMLKAADNLGYAIAKDVIDYALSQALVANVTATAVSNSPDRATLRAVTKAMNANGAGLVRYGIVNSDVYDTLDADPELASKDYAGQQQGANPWGTLANVAGFTNIWEYPDLPTNSQNLNGFFFDQTGMVLSSRAMLTAEGLREQMGVPAQAVVDTVRDPLTGLTFTTFTWQSNTTFNLLTKMVVLYGISVGKQGGSNGDKTDNGCFRLTSA